MESPAMVAVLRPSDRVRPLSFSKSFSPFLSRPVEAGALEPRDFDLKPEHDITNQTL